MFLDPTASPRTGTPWRPGRLVAPWGAILLAGCYSWAPVTTSDTDFTVKYVAGSGDAVWKEGVGWERPRAGGWGSPAHVRAEAMRAFEAGAHGDALGGFQIARQGVPAGDPSVADVQFHIAECQYRIGDYERAFESYRKVYREGRPAETDLSRTHQRMYSMALDYLEGRAGTALVFKWIPYKGRSYGVTLLVGDEPGEEGLITEYPYLDFADDAVMEVARYYREQEDYSEAERYYRRVVHEYPGREQHEPAMFLVGACLRDQIRGVDYEFDILLRTERAFASYLRSYPQGVHAEESRNRLREVAEMQGESHLRRAKFYLRESRLKAARIYLRIVMERYTTTQAAVEARDIVARLDRVEASDA